jgi:hypothetical protein
VGTVVRLYLGWRLFRLLRPLLGMAVITAAMLALHIGHAPETGSAASLIKHGAVAARRDLRRAPERALRPGPARP